MGISLQFNRVGVKIGGYNLLKSISFNLYPGELCALIGPSGAGKSTLIKVLLGLREASEGKVIYGRQPIQHAGPIGYVPQHDVLHLSLTVRQTLDFSCQLRLPNYSQKQRHGQILSVCNAVGLYERLDTKIKSLSGGQRKRVSVALELLSKPQILVLDEPTSGLDPGMERTSMQLFAKIAQQDRIVLVTTHSMQSIMQCNSLMVLMQGQLIYFGQPQQALNHFSVSRFEDIFSLLKQKSSAAWQRQYRANPYHAQFLARRPPRITVPQESLLPEHESLRKNKQDTPHAQRILAKIKSRREKRT